MSTTNLHADAQGLAEKFRHLASELRDARNCRGVRQYFDALIVHLDSALHEAYRRKQLPSPLIDAIDRKLNPSEPAKGLTVQLGPRLVSCVVGYLHGTRSEIEVYDGHFEQMTTIEPGAVAKVWPDVFIEIFPFIGLYRTIEDPSELWEEKLFEVIGFHAAACKLIGEWISQNGNATDAGSEKNTHDATAAGLREDDIHFLTAAIELQATDGVCVSSQAIATRAFGNEKPASRRLLERLKERGLIEPAKGGFSVTPEGCEFMKRRSSGGLRSQA